MQTDDSTAYFVEVYHDVALRPAAAHNVLQHQGEEQPSGLGHVQVVGVILVPVLNRRHHLVIICADYLQILKIENSFVGVSAWISQLNKTKRFRELIYMSSFNKEVILYYNKEKSMCSELVIHHIETSFSQVQQQLDLH